MKPYGPQGGNNDGGGGVEDLPSRESIHARRERVHKANKEFVGNAISSCFLSVQKGCRFRQRASQSGYININRVHLGTDTGHAGCIRVQSGCR